MLKHLNLALLMISAPCSFAGIMGACNPETVSIPCQGSGFDLAGRALYLQTSSNSHAKVYYSNGNTNNPFNLGANPSWSYGFQLEAAVHLDAGNDLNINWYHFRNETTQAVQGPVTYYNIVVTTPFTTTPTYYDSLKVNYTSTNINPQWDQVNMEFAKRVDLGRSDFLRLHGGLNYSRVANSGNNVFSGIGNISINNTSSSTNYVNSEIANDSYNGFGMRTGFDMNHDWGNGLVMYADAAASLLAGSAKSSYTFYDNLNSIYYSGVEAKNTSKVVPELDGRLGLNYTYAMVQGDVSLDLAWLWANYFDVLSMNENNFGIQGILFGLKWHGSMV